MREAWFWVRQRLLGMLPPGGDTTSNFEFLHLMFDSGTLDSEIVWLLGMHVLQVWNKVVCKKKHLRIDSVIADIAQEYRVHHMSNKPPLAHITGLLQ